MRHLTAIIMKFVAVSVILYVGFSVVAEANIAEVLLMSAVVTIISYVLGDLMVLPFSGNSIAVLSDIVLSAFVLWGLGYVLDNIMASFVNAMVFSVFLAIGEWFFHIYMQERVLETRYKDPRHA
ncbi:DUF2512 family protein [Bacillus xiapuensis]|uniref:DUF2512 family protein n=1 Tax=Bacillus xiapuensis TaxID=2014075 RepID=UPI0012FD87A9|nr:DUF2512 family protein [Bacillus xiapuensis]